MNQEINDCKGHFTKFLVYHISMCRFQKLDKNSKISSIKCYDSSIVITVFVKFFENCSGLRN